MARFVAIEALPKSCLRKLFLVILIALLRIHYRMLRRLPRVHFLAYSW